MRCGSLVLASPQEPAETGSNYPQAESQKREIEGYPSKAAFHEVARAQQGNDHYPDGRSYPARTVQLLPIRGPFPHTRQASCHFSSCAGGNGFVQRGFRHDGGAAYLGVLLSPLPSSGAEPGPAGLSPSSIAQRARTRVMEQSTRSA